MKIATPHCGFSPESNSGGETYERELLKSLARLGVQFEIIMAKGKPYPAGFPQFHVHELPIRKGLRWYVSNWLWPAWLSRIEKTCGFDLLRIHSLRFTGPGVLWFNARANQRYPVVCHHHHIDPSPLNPFIEKRVVTACDALITGSEFSKRQLIREFKTPDDKIHVVPYGIDDKFGPRKKDDALQAELGVKNEKVLLFLGGLKKRKKLFLLIDVLAEVMKRYHHPVKLILAGSGPLEKPLQDYVFSKHLEFDVIFTGYIPEEKKILFHNLADIFVFPSKMEGFGFSPAEAMACGKPVVCSDTGSLPEVVENGKTGFCVSNRVPDFADRIVRLLNNEEEALAFGRAGELRAKLLFQWPIAAKKTLDIYESVVTRHRSGADQ